MWQILTFFRREILPCQTCRPAPAPTSFSVRVPSLSDVETLKKVKNENPVPEMSTFAPGRDHSPPGGSGGASGSPGRGAGSGAGGVRAISPEQSGGRGGRGKRLLQQIRLQEIAKEMESSTISPAAASPTTAPPTTAPSTAGATAAVPATIPAPLSTGRGRATTMAIARAGPGGAGQAAAAAAVPVPEAASPEATGGPEPAAVRPPLLYRGRGGKPLDVSANYISLSRKPGTGVFEYEVVFSPSVDSRDQRFKLVGQQRETLGNARVFDGVKLFVPTLLTPAQTVLLSVQEATQETVELTLRFKGKRHPGERDVVHLYNILFTRIFRALGMAQHKRNFYDPAGVHHIRTYNLDVWPGYVTAVDNYEGGLLLQIDVSHRVLRTETVKDMLVSMHKKGVANVQAEADRVLIGMSVVTRYNNKSYRIDEVDFSSSPKSTFVNSRGQEVRFIDYYKNQYDIDVADPDQPMLVSKAKRKTPEGDEEALLCLIPELCLPTGMTDSMRADFRIMKEVGAFTRVTPENRQRALLKFVENVAKNPEAAAHLSGWGLALDHQTLPVRARVLDPEILHFGKSYREPVTAKADWGRAATSKNVLTAVSLSKWALIFVEANKAVVQNFCRIMTQQGPNMGIAIAMPRIASLPNDRTETYLKCLRELIDPSVQLVLTVFPQMKSDRYSAIKKLCCIEKPVASQVINLKTISQDKKTTSVAQKVILQINCKLGGELWTCQTPFKHLMVIGIDVFHDKSQKSGSIAGIVSTLNDNMSRYFSTVAMQRQGQEIVDALTIEVTNALGKYYEVNHRFPDNIVVFRDGVGDGMLEVTEKQEAEQLARVFKHVKGAPGSSTQITLPEGYDPGFNFVVVQKRINTRIFSIGPNKTFDNPPPGTVLDHTVTRYNYRDFFLVSQKVNQGTVSPTHCIVLRESGTEFLVAEEVQKLAYKMTHMYFNWPGTVSVPAPCQYAHKLVSLVGEHLHRAPAPQLSDKLFYL